MKKIILALSLILSVLLVAGCSNKSGNSPEPGTWTENTYVNEFAKLNFTLPDGWVASTDEELSALMDSGAEALKESGVKFSKKALELQTLYGMMAQNPENNSSVILMFENLAMSGSSKMTVEEYMNTVKTQLESAAPASVEFADSYEETIGENTYTVLKMDYPEIPGLSQYYYITKADKYITALIVTATPEETIENIMANFS